MDVDELVMAAIQVEKQAKLLVEVANKLYDTAITLAIDSRYEKEPIEYRAVPVPANMEEE